MEPNYPELLEKLKAFHQEHLLTYWSELTVNQQHLLKNEIESMDLALIQRLHQELVMESIPAPINESGNSITPLNGKPWDAFSIAEKAAMANTGMRAIRDGKVAAFLVAGGQGTRLGHNGPKGTLNIGLPSGKSLFELQAERLLKLGQKAGRSIPWYIMTSADNHQATTQFFEANNLFKIKQENLFFFQQDQLPVVDQNGKIILDEKHHTSQGPNGNGGCFLGLQKSGALADMKKRGIEWVFIYSVDNALVQICDPHFVGFTIASGKEAASKSVTKTSPEERVGVFCLRDGYPSVIEYSELDEEMRQARDGKGDLLFGSGNIAVHLFHLDFLEREAVAALPYHAAHKRIPYIAEGGPRIQPTAPNAWKFELFMFDLFPRSKSMAVMAVNRSDEFAPVKNRDGVDSPESARKLVLEFENRTK
jgi:UDP-N-acetylglucosamine/UDP-N-acetylgalactosamine diphosphorylase